MNIDDLRDMISAAESLYKRLSAQKTDGTEVIEKRVSWALEGLQQAVNNLILLRLFLEDGTTDEWTDENKHLALRRE